jgi:hypothetical protein
MWKLQSYRGFIDMAGISFSVFREQILSGAKCQTIRAVRKDPIKVGETLYLWWKQRSPQREKLGEATCVKTYDVEIHREYLITHQDNRWQTIQYLNSFAKDDGFNNWQELVEFFENTHGLPFKGVLIKWNDLRIKPSPEFIEALNKYVFDNGLPESYYDQRDDD